jgi:hypothetical protein
MRANQRRYALAAAVAAVFVALAIVTAGLRGEPAVVTTSPSPAAPTTATPIADAPRAIFSRHVVLDTVPGGGPVLGPQVTKHS